MKETKRTPVSRIKPLKKSRFMGDAAYASLKDAIINGTLPQGQRLIETQLSLQMKVSRVPIREAMKRLEQDGLLEKTGKRGFVVKELSKDEIYETLGIRALLESYAASLATTHIDAALIKKLEDNMENYRLALEVGDTEKLLLYNTLFHEIIYKAAGSNILYTVIYHFRDFLAHYRRMLLSCTDYARLSLNDHKDMIEAMRDKDREKVEQIVKKHILSGKGIFDREMDSGKSL
jgi:DNA-binding GntR family transcriptional regulator